MKTRGSQVHFFMDQMHERKKKLSNSGLLNHFLIQQFHKAYSLLSVFSFYSKIARKILVEWYPYKCIKK